MTDRSRTFLKWSVPTYFLTKKQFYYRKIFVITCHLNCILWMKDNVRQVVSTFLNAVFKPSLKIGIYPFHHLTINCCHFLPDCLLQIGQGARFVSIDMWFEVSPQKKKSHKWSNQGTLGATGCRWNVKWPFLETCDEPRPLTIVQCVGVAPSCWK